MTNLAAIQFAIKAHSDVNHLYNGLPYSVHLAMVVHYGYKYIDLVSPGQREDVIDACWCHDTIEDCRKSYNDVAQALGAVVAELVYAVTNEKGRTRRTRASESYYAGIRKTLYATFVKLCDRMANVEFSFSEGHSDDYSMFKMYASENEHFISSLFPEGVAIGIYAQMVSDLKIMVKRKTS